MSTTSAQLINWTTNVTALKGKVTSLWEADHTIKGNIITAKGKPWNSTIKNGKTASFGYCAG